MKFQVFHFNYLVQLAAVDAKQRWVASSSTVNHISVVVNLPKIEQK